MALTTQDLINAWKEAVARDDADVFDAFEKIKDIRIYKPNPLIDAELPMRLDGTGTINANGDYSAAPVQFYVTNPYPDKKIHLTRLLVLVQEDAGSIDSDTYGNGLILTNGIKGFFYDAELDTNIYETDPELVVFKNPDWGAFAGVDVDIQNYGNGADALLVRITFTKMGGEIILNPGDKFGVVLEDNFSGLARQVFNCQGYIN